MPSFLSKVFVRKRDEKDSPRSNKRSSVASLLEGKFEAVSPNVSPSASNFPELSAPSVQLKEKEREKEKEKEGGFSLFKTRSRPHSPNTEASKSASNIPHLSLSLPVPKEESTRALGVVFEGDPDDHSTLPDGVIGERRLSPLEALLLVKACGSAIIEHGGLETLGVMHPHWYSASTDVQRKLISLFVLSLSHTSPVTTLAPSPGTRFARELEFTRSPHDIAAVLRWALRHLRLEGDGFGGGAQEQWQWYRAFVEGERAGAYPPDAFSRLLLPQLPAAHMQLLVATLEIVSSLAAHSEHNGISGSKFSKFVGLWLLTSRRAEGEDDWLSFYARWERAGRILEHMFLAQIRDEMVHKKMPLRLTELVGSYPYAKTSTSPSEDDLLPRPRLSTRRYDALFVRISTPLPSHATAKPKQHPLRLIADAVKSEPGADGGEYDVIWDIIKKAAAEPDEVESYPALTRLFTEETIRLLSLIPAESNDSVSPTFSIPTSPIRSRPVRRRSTSLGVAQNGNGNGKAVENGNGKARVASETTMEPTSPKDWTDFSALGFGDNSIGTDFAKTLLDTDVEVTMPQVGRKSSKKRKASPARSRRSSVDSPAPTSQLQPTSPKPVASATVRVDLVQLDEAFIDFWSDALLDPIAADWPCFVVCQLRPLAGLQAGGKSVGWLILEQVFARPPPPSDAQPTSPTSARRASSPRPSLRSNISTSRASATFAGARKRFTFFGGTTPTLGSPADAKFVRKKAKTPIVGEMGEILSEEDEKPDASSATAAGPAGLGLTGVIAAITPDASAADLAVAADATGIIKASELPAVPIVEASQSPIGEAVPSVTEPINTEPAAEKLTVALPQDIAVPVDVPTSEANVVPESKALPPAPEPVVLTGETPGPEVALNTSEPVALAGVSSHGMDGEPAAAPTDLPTGQPPMEKPLPEPVVEDSPVAEEAVLEEEPIEEEEPTVAQDVPEVPIITHAPTVVDDIVPLVEPSTASEPTIDKAIVETREIVEPSAEAHQVSSNTTTLDTSPDSVAPADEPAPVSEPASPSIPDQNVVSLDAGHSVVSTAPEVTLLADEATSDIEAQPATHVDSGIYPDTSLVSEDSHYSEEGEAEVSSPAAKDMTPTTQDSS